MHRFGWVYGLALGTALVSSASASSVSLKAIDGGYWGPHLGLFFPSSTKMRNLLGSTWYSFGVGPTRFDVKEGLSVSTDLHFISQRRNGNKVFIALPTVGVTQALGRPDNATQPYARLQAGLVYMDYSITDGVYKSKKRFGVSANAEVGFVLNERLKIAARYDWMSSYDKLSFNGLSLNVVYQLFKF